MDEGMTTSAARGKGLNRRFVAVAEEQLEPGLFAKLLALAEDRLKQDAGPTALPNRHEPEAVPVPVEVKQKADKAAVIERVSAALNKRPVARVEAHAATRLNERLGIEVGPQEIGELTQFILQGGPNVTKIKREVRAVDHYRVIWRGVEFLAVLAIDRKELITIRRVAKVHRARAGRSIRSAREASRRKMAMRDLDLEEIEVGL